MSDEITAPRLYKVLLHNDDKTPMAFVVSVLNQIFNFDEETSAQTAQKVHEKGVYSAGVYIRDVAQTKATIALENAKKFQYPFNITIEVA